MTLLKSGAHFGHQLSRRNPKMQPYIFMQKNGFHIINLEETQRRLRQALDYVTQVAAQGGIVLFLGTKKQVKDIIRTAAESCGMPYVTERWLGGTFTNYSSVSKLIKKYADLTSQKASGELQEKYTKKEQLEFDKEISKLQQSVGGIANLKKIPDAIFISDLKKEKTAVAEANNLHIPVVAICDTNVNPEKAQYPIPANDDYVKSVELFAMLMAQAVREGVAKAKATAAAVSQKAEVESSPKK